MYVTIDPTLLDKIPQFKMGVIHYNKIIVSDSPQMIKGRMQLYQENLFFELQEQSVTDRPNIKEWRTLLKSVGMDVNRYRHSAEGLLRRIAKQQYLTPVHTAVDLNNFFSLQYEIPVGIYDKEAIQGDIFITLGEEGTGYEGLNSRFNTLHAIPHSQDEAGPFGSLYVDSKRTATSEQTTEAIQLFYIRPSMNEEEAIQLLSSAGNMFTQICGGTFQASIIKGGA